MTEGRDHSHRARWLVPALAVLAAGIAIAVTIVVRLQQPGPIDAVLCSYRTSSLPDGAPAGEAPSLTAAGLTLEASGVTVFGDDLGPVDTFVYETDDGSTIVLYASAVPFPRPRDVPDQEPSDRWSGDVDGVFMTSIEEPNPFLIVGSDRNLVDHAAGGAEHILEPSRFQGHRTASPGPAVATG